jgi:hypothetical protein
MPELMAQNGLHFRGSALLDQSVINDNVLGPWKTIEVSGGQNASNMDGLPDALTH